MARGVQQGEPGGSGWVSRITLPACSKCGEHHVRCCGGKATRRRTDHDRVQGLSAPCAATTDACLISSQGYLIAVTGRHHSVVNLINQPWMLLS